MYWKPAIFAAVASGTATAVGTGFSNGTVSANSTASPTSVATTLSKTSAFSTGTAATSSSTSLSTSTPGARYVTAHPDGQCQKSLNSTSEGDDTFFIDAGFPKFTTIKATTFPGAEATTGGGYNVWWHFPDPGVGCRTQLMLPYAQSAGTPGKPGGIEIINVAKAGCFFGNIPTDSEILLSYCCGADDCGQASLNSTNLLASPHSKRDASMLQPEAPEAEAKRATKPVAPVTPTVKRSGSLAVRANQELEERFYYTPPPPSPTDTGCAFKAGTPYSQAGPQVVVTDSLRCPTAPCTFAVNQAVSFSTTATSSTDQTITNSVGGSVTVTTGESLIQSFSVAVAASYDFSDAISKTTGSSIMNGNSTTITSTVSVMLGNEGAVTFTPVYKCYVGPMDCGKGVSDPITVCQPDMLSLNGAPNGEYGAVTWG